MQLEVSLTTPIEQLIPAMIGFNNEELMRNAKAIAESYEGRVYTEDLIGDAKTDLANLRKVSKALDSWRLDIKKKYEVPYNEFKKRVDEVTGVINGVIAVIDEQVKGFEEERKQRKMEEIRTVYLANIGDLADYVPLEKIFNEKWLNSTAKLSAIEEEIKQKVKSIGQDLSVIRALGGDYETLFAFYFRTLSLSETLSENERLKADKKKVEQLSMEMVEKPLQAKQEPLQCNSVATMEVRFRCIGTIEQMRALRKFLDENKIKFEKI